MQKTITLLLFLFYITDRDTRNFNWQ